MSQTTAANYGFEIPIAQAGQLADASFKNVRSYAAEEDIAFGLGVTQGTADDQVLILDTAGQSFLGIALFSHGQEQGRVTSFVSGAQTSNGAAYSTTDTVNVMTNGVVYMTTNFAASADDTAFIDAYTPTGKGQATPVVAATVITFDADFVASNTINGTVNGEAIVQVTYATSHAATFAAVVASIETEIGTGLSIPASQFSVVGNAVARTIVIQGIPNITAASIVVAAGASQAGVTIAKTTNVSTGGKFRTSAAASGLAAVEINQP